MKMYDEKRAFDLLGRMAFTRIAGTPEELKAAELLKAECESFGLSAAIEPFEIDGAIRCEASLTVTAPYQKQYPVRGYLCAESTPENGLTAPLVYVENAVAANLVGVRGKVVLVNGFLRVPVYKALMEAGAAAILTMDGSLRDEMDKTDLHQRKLRATMRTFGCVPAAHLRVADAMEMVSKGAAEVCLKVENENGTFTSHNVVAEILGTDFPEEMISFGAHYDSVEFSKGVYDNGAGSVVLMEAARWFKENPPKRTVKLCWYGSEEIGLEGSRAFVRDHKDELKNHRLMINVDVGAPILGVDRVAVTAGEDLLHFVDYLLKIRGYAAETRAGIYSSDSIPFADSGVPAVNFSRDGAQGAAFIHNRFDDMDFLSAEALGKTARIVMTFADAMINAAAFPVERKVPDNIHEEIDKYLFKKELEEIKAE